MEEREDDEVFEVEKVVGERIKGRKRQYLLKWKGYGHNENTWEDEANCDCTELIKEFKERKSLIHKVVKSTLELKKPKKVVGAFKRKGKVFYKVLYEGDTEPVEVSASEIRVVADALAIEYLEDTVC